MIAKDTKIKIYISGPITGYENGNKPAFENAKTVLSRWGYDVVSPFDHDDQEVTETYDDTYWRVLSKDIVLMSKVEGIVYLPGWEKSKGARVEAFVALSRGLPMWEYLESGEEASLEELKYNVVAGVCVAEWIPKEILQKFGLAA